MAKYDNYIGRVFADRYEIINVVGTGGSGVIFGVYDSVEDRTAAIKMLRPEYESDEEAVERFKKEAEILSLFSHPGIVRLYDKKLEGFPKYFIMEYVEGITLKKHILSRGAMSQEEIFLIIKPVLLALGEVHKKGIVHCDIKPQNIVVLADGSVRLMDFGISRESSRRHIIENVEDTYKDEPMEMAIGTVHYVSPEQAEAKKLDGRSDLYSLGVTMYEMVTGIPPFFGDTPSKIAAMHVNELPIAPHIVNPAVTPEMEEIILRAMEKPLDSRYQTAAEFYEDIEKAEKHQVEEEPQLTFKEKVIDYLKNFSVSSGVAGALCALLVTVVISLGVLSLSILNERELHNHVKVPDLYGVTYSQLDSLGLDYDYYEIDVSYKNSNKNGGKIISQSPHAKKVVKLKDGEKCRIKISVAYLPLPDAMPNLVAMNAGEAKAILESYGCKVTVVTAPHEYIPSGNVISTFPSAGEKPVGEITLTVSGGYQE